MDETREAYDSIASSYADETRDLLDRLLHVRAGVVLFADLIRASGGGPVADVGCGPGRTSTFLRELGVDSVGIDLSPAMIEIARREHPGGRFEVGSMTRLEFDDTSLAGVLAWWSLIHIPDETVPDVLAEFHRVLRPDGVLAIGFHVGDGVERTGAYPSKAQGYQRRPSQVSDWLRGADFALESQQLLSPDGPRPGAILFARKPLATRTTES
ncbi:class I SAM-dependent methyltransferase [Saccharopolyspora tripterygii]